MGDLVGKQLEEYQIVEEIGRGGMAVVYKAYQPSLNRYVAIKVLKEHLSDDRALVQRFLREARAAATLQHPNIIHIYHVGRKGDLYYFVMDYIAGPSLAAKLKAERSLDLPTALSVLRQVGSALDDAHGQGVVHRDVKPSNILLTPNGQAILSDFGIAKAAAESRLTQTGTVVGTPEYMSPEQAEGKRVDTRSDLYSLGVVLYEMLTGRVPFEADTPLAVLYKHVHEPPRAPSRLNPGISRDVEKVVLRALAKDRAKRYQSAGGMANALSAALASSGAGRGRAGPISLPTGGQRTAPFLAVVAVLAVILLLVFATGGWPPPDRPTPTIRPTRAVTPSVEPTVAQAPALTFPEDGGTVTGREIPFQWSWDGSLQDDEHFDVRVFRMGAAHSGVAWTKETRYDFSGQYLGGGDYCWSAAVIRDTGEVSPEGSKKWEPVSEESEVWCFTYSPPPPTPTPPPTWTPEPRPTEPPAPTGTPLPPPTSTPLPPPPTPTRTPVAAPGLLEAPVLESPGPGAELRGETITFRWRWHEALKQDQHFDVRVWREGDPHNGIAWTNDTWLEKRGLGGGTWFWSIAVLRDTGQINPDGSKKWEAVSEESEARWFNYSPSAGPTGPPVGPTPTRTPMF